MSGAEEFNAEVAGKEAIATSPEFTEGVNFAPDEDDISGNQALIPQNPTVEYEPDKRNGRLLGLTLQQWDKHGRLEDAQIDAAEEIGGEAFGAIKAAAIPNIVKILITFTLLVLSIVPLGMDIFTSLQTEKDNKNGDD